MGNLEKMMRAKRIDALETLCMGLPDCDKHFLAGRLRAYDSAGGNCEPFTAQSYAQALSGGGGPGNPPRPPEAP